MMTSYGEDSIKALMPIIVTILESLDQSLTKCKGLCTTDCVGLKCFFNVCLNLRSLSVRFEKCLLLEIVIVDLQ